MTSSWDKWIPCPPYHDVIVGYMDYTSPLRPDSIIPNKINHSKTCLDHDDVIKWKYFPRYWPFVREIHRSPVNSPHKGQWRGALMLSIICAWINGWVNNHEVGDLRRHRAHHCDDLIKRCYFFQPTSPVLSFHRRSWSPRQQTVPIRQLARRLYWNTAAEMIALATASTRLRSRLRRRTW